MSNVTRWMLGLLLILIGIGAGFLAVFSGGLMTIGCIRDVPEMAYNFLVIGGGLTALGAIVPAVMLIRKSKTGYILIALILGIVLSCAFYIAYFLSLGGSC